MSERETESMNNQNVQNALDQSSKAIDSSQHKKLAMTVAIISWSMLFATLLLGYFVYRFSQTVWPPLGVASIPMTLPNISLLVVMLSSLTLWFAQVQGKASKNSSMRIYTMATFVLGITYMVVQFMFWNQLNDLNVYSSSNIFGSILHGFTWIHAGHMVGAVIALLFYIAVTQKDARIKKWESYFANTCMFWHFLTLIWAVLYFTLFIF